MNPLSHRCEHCGERGISALSLFAYSMDSYVRCSHCATEYRLSGLARTIIGMVEGTVLFAGAIVSILFLSLSPLLLAFTLLLGTRLLIAPPLLKMKGQAWNRESQCPTDRRQTDIASRH